MRRARWRKSPLEASAEVSGIHWLSDLRRLLTPLGKSMDPCRPLAADSWKEREACLSRAHEAVAAMQNELRVTPPLKTGVTPFHGCPYLVLHAERFAAALEDAVGDPRVQALPRGVGSADQITDITDVLDQNARPLPE